MKKLNTQEYNNMKTLRFTYSKWNGFTQLLLGLDIGDGVFLDQNEWTLKSFPTALIQTIYKKHPDVKFKSKRVNMDSSTGWAILRIK